MSAEVYESREMNHVLFISVHPTQGSILPHCRRVDSKLRLRSAVTRARLWRDLWCSVSPNNPPGHQNDRHQCLHSRSTPFVAAMLMLPLYTISRSHKSTSYALNSGLREISSPASSSLLVVDVFCNYLHRKRSQFGSDFP